MRSSSGIRTVSTIKWSWLSGDRIPPRSQFGVPSSSIDRNSTLGCCLRNTSFRRLGRNDLYLFSAAVAI